jgi:hypothetical protein
VPKYLVSVEEVVRHTVEVTADDEGDAGEVAIQALIDDGSNAYFMSIEDRRVYMVLKQGD